MLNLSITYRTRENKRVRGLHFKTRQQNHSMGSITVIIGQVWRLNDLSNKIEWCTEAWNQEGKDLLGRRDMDLTEYKEPVVKQPKLF